MVVHTYNPSLGKGSSENLCQKQNKNESAKYVIPVVECLPIMCKVIGSNSVLGGGERERERERER
jgi:hypothetical protein